MLPGLMVIRRSLNRMRGGRSKQVKRLSLGVSGGFGKLLRDDISASMLALNYRWHFTIAKTTKYDRGKSIIIG